MDKSDTIAKLASALVAFEAEVTNPKNSAENPFHHNRYAPLQDILAYVRPLLAKHKLAVSQLLHSEGESIGVTTVLMHESGEYIAETATISVQSEKGKSHAQLAGSNVTYLRRYALAAVLGIASEDDDDGNAGLQRQRESKPASKPVEHKQAASPKQQQDYSQYLELGIDDISPSKYPWALRAEIDWLRAHNREQAAIEFEESAQQRKSEGAKAADYLDLLKEARKMRVAAEDMDRTEGYKDKEPSDKGEIF